MKYYEESYKYVAVSVNAGGEIKIYLKMCDF